MHRRLHSHHWKECRWSGWIHGSHHHDYGWSGPFFRICSIHLWLSGISLQISSQYPSLTMPGSKVCPMPSLPSPLALCPEVSSLPGPCHSLLYTSPFSSCFSASPLSLPDFSANKWPPLSCSHAGLERMEVSFFKSSFCLRLLSSSERQAPLHSPLCLKTRPLG